MHSSAYPFPTHPNPTDPEAHFFESMGGPTGSEHALVLSLSDLSIWCYSCGCYVKHDRLLPALVRAEAMYVRTLFCLGPMSDARRKRSPTHPLIIPPKYIHTQQVQGPRQDRAPARGPNSL